MTAALLIESHNSFYKSFLTTGYLLKPNKRTTNFSKNFSYKNLAGNLLKAHNNIKGTSSTPKATCANWQKLSAHNNYYLMLLEDLRAGTNTFTKRNN